MSTKQPIKKGVPIAKSKIQGIDKTQPMAKAIDFYRRLRDQYNNMRPITYQIDLISTQPKTQAAKFGLMITKFITIFKSGMCPTYDNEDDRKQNKNYWNKIEINFHDDYQIGFVNETIWEKPKNKLKRLFGLLIYTKRIFTFLERCMTQIPQMYQNIEQKKKSYEEQIKTLDFLKDGQYQVMGGILVEYDSYVDKRRQQLKLQQLKRQQQQRLRQQQEKRRKEKQQVQRKERQEKERKQREQEQKRKKVQQAMKEAAKKKQQEDGRRLITSDYFPPSYEEAWNNSHNNKIPKSASKSKLDLPNYNVHRDGKLKNSDKLYKDRYQEELNFFTYALKPQNKQENATTCFTCKCNLAEGLSSFWNKNYCHYTGKWYCNQDISEQRMPIPWKALYQFDLSGYTVSKAANAQLKAYYQKPILQLKKDNPIIKQNKKLYDFLVVRRQIHLIYDSICNLEYIEPMMRKRENYCLKMNLFSMKNLYDIYHGQETIKLTRDYEILAKHFYRCEICQKKKGYVCSQCKDPVKIFPFQLKETIGCSSCRKLYHRKCIPSAQCKCKTQD